MWYVAPGRAEIRREPLPIPGPGDVLVRATHGAISRGTERLVLSGRVPASEHARMRGPHMGGTFPFPVKYGYATVGVVEAGAVALIGRPVFALHPHQSRFVLPAEMVVPIPESVPARRAVLAANMETALNAVWDAAPGPADRIAVVGAGVVGLLVAHLCAGIPGTEVTVVDVAPERAATAAALGLAFAAPAAAADDCDLVVHASATAAGLATALSLAGDEATVLELSWYGETAPAVPLGGAFHSRRLTLRSSQVGQVAPSRRPRWTHRRRLEAALTLLADARLDALLGPPVRFADLPARITAILAPDAAGLCPVIDYGAG
ncbi:MAG: zinc-binding alcohol dehydrogenase [Rhodovulum sp.]|nr:zinc-binding alcohol dehydrogenase [Rhodovulum sp.]